MCDVAQGKPLPRPVAEMKNGVRSPMDYFRGIWRATAGDLQFRPPGDAPRNGGVPGGSSVGPKTRHVAEVAL
jgi:hypothetical protein